MREQFIPFSRIPEGSVFKARGTWWLKVIMLKMRSGTKLNAFAVDPTSAIVDMAAGHFFDEATLVRLVHEELPLSDTKVTVLPLRART